MGAFSFRFFHVWDGGDWLRFFGTVSNPEFRSGAWRTSIVSGGPFLSVMDVTVLTPDAGLPIRSLRLRYGA